MPTSSDRTPRRLRLRSQQRGAAGVFLVISLLLLVPILALALNIGQLYYAQRDLEKQATLAALSATQVASGCANDGRPGLLAAVTQEVIRIIAANNVANAAAMAALAVLCALLLERGWTMREVAGFCGIATLGLAAWCARLARSARTG